MVSSKYLWASALLAVAGLTFTACEEKNEEDVEELVNAVVSLKYDKVFSEEGTASLTLNLSEACPTDVVVTLAAGSEAQAGKTAVAADALTFDSNVLIATGTTSAKLDVTVDFSKAEAGQQAVIVIASVNGITIDKEAAIAYIEVPSIEPPLDLSGAEVWGIIGAFNSWGGDVKMTKIADSPETWAVENVTFGGEFKFRGNEKWDNYDLGASDALVIGEPLTLVHRGANITIPDGTWNVTLYPTELKALITEGESKPQGSGNLDWTVAYNGCDWVEGYLSYGQIESFTVADTDVKKFYYPMVVNLAEDDDVLAILSGNQADAYFAEMQESITATLQVYAESYQMSFEDLVPELFYNEENDGTELLMEGFPAGNYQFVVLSMDASGNLDKGWIVCPFTKDVDPIAYYPWFESYNKRDDWGAVWDGWYPGYEGKYYNYIGHAPGAVYVAVDTYTDDELAEYYDGKFVDMFNYTASSLADYLVEYDIEELAEYGVVLAVESDGSFMDYMSTYGLTGITNLYIIAFDAQGHILQDYGVSPIEIPEFVPVEVNWVEHPEWALNYDASVDTGEANYPQALVATACNAQYFIIAAAVEGTLVEYGINEVGTELTADYKTYISDYGYTIDELIEYGVVFDHVPAVSSWRGLYNGVEAYLFAIDAAGNPTGDWHMEVLTGIEEVPPTEMTLVPEWSITPVGDAFKDDSGYWVVAVEVKAKDIKWYLAEENSPQDLVDYYGGSIAGYADKYQAKLQDYIAQGYTIDQLIYSNEDPIQTVYVYNFDTPTSIYIVEFDETGKATGRFGKTDCTIPTPESQPSDVEWVLQPDWSITPVGEVWADEKGYDHINVEINAPGIKWYFAEENTQEDLDYYYDGSIAGYAEAYEEDLTTYIASGYTMDQLAYYSGDPLTDVYVWNMDVPTSIYIVEFDENGKATGRYGKTDCTIASPASAPKAAPGQKTAEKFSLVKKELPAAKAMDTFGKSQIVKKVVKVANPERDAVKLQKKECKALNVNRTSIKANKKAFKAEPGAKITKKVATLR